MLKRMNRKGEGLSARAIILLVLTIAGFLIAAMFLLLHLNQDDLTRQELCHLSIVERATAPGLAEKAIPLQCFTEKICITTDKNEECKKFSGEEKVRIVVVDMPESKTEKGYLAKKNAVVKTIEEESANAMYDCWRMTGQGKLDVFKGSSSGATGTVQDILGVLGSDIKIDIKQPKCIVCSRLALSEDLIEKDGKIRGIGTDRILDSVDVNGYLESQTVPGSTLTYLQTFTDEGVRSYAGINRVDESTNPQGKISESANQIAMIFMQIKTEENPSAVGEEAALSAGIAIGGGGLMTGLGRKIISSHPFVSFLAATGAVGGAYLYSSGVASDNQAISTAVCGEYLNDENDAKLGCSLVKPIKWDAGLVNDLCPGGTEGNL
ncbi:MAG: hypothetical protein Q8P57_02270 [Candidatus Pacearchaeota archaeon]|nr:hypothetical protein [Candidatus Pacearchaeota archaeon]